MNTLQYILVSVLIVSLISLLGVFTLSLKKKKLHQTLSLLVAFAAGSMLGAAFFDLFPESVEHVGAEQTFTWALVGMVAFFVIEKFFYWYHCHGGRCAHHGLHGHKHIAPYAYLNLIGDGIHNFIDGAVIAVAYLNSIPLGVVASIAVVFHEIPQEIGDFAIMVQGGMDRVRALGLNFLTALAAFLGALLTFYFAGTVEGLTGYLLPFAAGNFLYIATADLIPELHKEETSQKNAQQLALFIGGILLILVVKSFFGHGH
ncbi:ZIP family metal transporter [Candidatus Woesearchaeota archaeon]|nr:ZIP family metal transporter [Candidatus Woesearchaeota archaeon]